MLVAAQLVLDHEWPVQVSLFALLRRNAVLSDVVDIRLIPIEFHSVPTVYIHSVDNNQRGCAYHDRAGPWHAAYNELRAQYDAARSRTARYEIGAVID